ncbi:40S ribosomal protein S7 [Atta colombica]|uniref:40S ribosomal protein S7 n=1 Tax=Atta colombica TaxID=520822 RepID=A0A151I1Y6_9HYME|nr:40S ribosomal protein S7 [Atta colombica]
MSIPATRELERHIKVHSSYLFIPASFSCDSQVDKVGIFEHLALRPFIISRVEGMITTDFVGFMFTANAKIIKSGGSEPDQFEASISNALLELEMNSDLKSHLRELYITKAKELETNNKKSIIIYVPMPKLKAFQKIQTRLVRELEKKFSGKHVMFVGERKILPKPTRKTRTKNKQKRPRSRTLTSVYDALLEDIVYPVEIVGKRIRVKLDGSQVIKVHLDKNEQTNIEHKVDTFASVYKQLTGRDVTFEFPESYV